MSSSRSVVVKVSIALPVYNAEKFLDECFDSILKQELDFSVKNLNCHNNDTEKKLTCEVLVEVSVYDDGSTDSSPAIISKWAKVFNDNPGFSFVFTRNESGSPKGVGFARNQTIRQSKGDYICFCDADDIMRPRRIVAQLKLCMEDPDAIVGSKFRKLPEDATRIFTKWANSLTQAQLMTQVFLSFGPSIVMPTWFCHRKTYDLIEGGFDERGKGIPEDLIFFYKHLDRGGSVVRVDEELVVYRYHLGATTFSVTDEIIWNTRLEKLERRVLQNWNEFTIWNAGKLGRRLFRSLRKENQEKVRCLCDVDKKKINQKLYHPYPIPVKIPIVHVKDAKPPFLICVKTELTLDAQGDFRMLLDSMSLEEGKDYFYFN